MKKLSAVTIIGILIIISGIGMFCFGASIFSYQGNSLSPIVSKLGMYSFFCWFPVIVFGIVFLFVGRAAKKQFRSK